MGGDPDTGMGRTGNRSDRVPAFLERCRDLPALQVRGLMSRFPRADEGDVGYSLAQLDRFRAVVKGRQGMGIAAVTVRFISRGNPSQSGRAG
jgi:alanine racemase